MTERVDFVEENAAPDHGAVPRAAAEAAEALLAAMSARLDAGLASFELSIRAARAAGPDAARRRAQEPAAVLAELERELAELERRYARRYGELADDDALASERDAYRNAVAALRQTAAPASGR
jgi:hypothetical protein